MSLRPTTLVEWLVLGAAVAIAVTLSALGASVWLAVNLLLLLAWTIPMLVLHECAHAMVARLLGLRVFWVMIGFGPPLLELRVLGTRVSVNAIPLMAMTAAAARDTARIRGRMVAFILAGPATHLLLGVAGVVVVGANDVWEQLRSLGFNNTLLAGAMFVAANAILFVVNLLPLRTPTPMGIGQTDGHHLLRALFFDATRIAEYRSAYSCLEAYELRRRGKLDAAISSYEEAVREHPASWLIRHDLAVARLDAGAFSEARSVFVELLQSEAANEEPHRLLLMNNIAYSTAMMADASSDLLAEADAYSAEVLSKAPRVAPFRGTRGAVLIRLGHVEEGLKHCQAAYRQNAEPQARAANASWIAIGYAIGGDHREARAWVEKARAERASTNTIAWVENELSARGIASCQ